MVRDVVAGVRTVRKGKHVTPAHMVEHKIVHKTTGSRWKPADTTEQYDEAIARRARVLEETRVLLLEMRRAKKRI